MRILTIYDGTIQSKTALQYGLRKAKEQGGEVIVLHAFQSSRFIDYDAGPKAEEIARAEAAQHLDDAKAMIREAGQGVAVSIVSEEGEAEGAAVRLAGTERVDLLLASPRYKAIAKTAACAVLIIPGTILVPVDSSDTLLANKGHIIEEAKATGSKVLLLGIVPVHLYSAGEKKELEEVRKGTASAVRRVKNALSEQGIDVSDVIRSGYPDEEILKAAVDYAASLIMLPSGGKTPSELTKAAAILLDEPERARTLPIQIMRTAAAS
jgi:nucleotide-binding universal stress UspA family protein